MKRKILAIIVAITMIATLLSPMLTVGAATESKTVVFEIGEVVYNAEYGEIEVPLNIVENNSDIYAAEIVLESNDGLVCSTILDGTIKDEIDKGGRVGVVEFGFNYTHNPYLSKTVVDSAEASVGVTTTGLVATWCFTAPEGFTEADLANYTFKFGEATMLVAFDGSYPVAVLKDRDVVVPPVEPEEKTVSFEIGEVVYNAQYGEIEVPLNIVENNSDIYTAEIVLENENGLVCAAILEGNIKDEIDKGGREGVVEFGFNYTMNPAIAKVVLCSNEPAKGISTTGNVVTFCFTAPDGFSEADMDDYVFSFGEETMLVAYDLTEPVAVLKNREIASCEHAVTYEVVTLEPTCMKTGSKNVVCDACGKVLETVVIPKVKHTVLPDTDNYVVFEIGELTYNESFNEIEVPLYIIENNSDIYAAEIQLLSNDGLVCSAIVEGNIKDEIDKGGRVGVVEFGFNYTPNPAIAKVVIDSAEPTVGVATTGLVATFCYTAPEGFTEADMADYKFSLGEATMLVAFDGSYPAVVFGRPDDVVYEEEIIKAPTCTETGLKNVYCVECGVYVETNAVIEASGHELQLDSENSVAPTCTEAGVNVYKCYCGEFSDTVEVPATGHMFEPDPENDVPATCTEPGKKAYKCHCGETEFVEVAAAHGVTKDVVTLEPTCIETGSKNIVCTVCDEVLETVVIPKVKHTVLPDTDNYVVFEIGELTYNESFNEIQVPLYIVENSSDIYAAEIVLENGNGLVCSAIVEGNIKDEIDKGGRVGVVEFGFNYTPNPAIAKVVIDSAEPTVGVATTGWVVTFCFTAPKGFTEADMADYKFSLGEATMLVAFDGSYPAVVFGRPDDVVYEEEIIKAPTCTETGIKNIVCTQCNVVIESVVIDALGHGETHEVVTKEATCIEAGSKNIVCDICDEILETIVIPKVKHIELPDTDDYIVFEIGELTYNEALGEIEVPLYITENNSDIYAAEIQLLSNDGLACSAIIDGTITDQIDKGGREGIVEFGFNYLHNPALNKTVIDSQEVTVGVSTTGLVATWCFVAPAGFTEADLANYTFKFGESTLLVAFDGPRPAAVLGSKLVTREEIVKEPNCTETGIKNIICDECNVVIDTVILETVGHVETKEVVTLEPTCTEKGSKNIVCTVCEEVIEIVEIEATGHVETKEVITLEPTCTKQGSKNIVCTACGEILETVVIAAKGHNFERDEANDIAPTCTKDGKYAYQCECGSILFEPGAPATGHGEAKEVITLAPTCTTDGSKNFVCEICGEVLNTAVIPAAHGETKEVITKVATCMENGSKNIVCTVCDEILDTIVIPKVQHVVYPDTDDYVVFTLGKYLYNSELNRIEVPVYIKENNSNVYCAEIVLLSNNGLECSAILNGTIKESYTLAGRDEIIEFGFDYISNPILNKLVIDSTDATRGVTATGLVATFCFAVPEGFSESDLEAYTFSFGESTMLVNYNEQKIEAVLDCSDKIMKEVVVTAPTCTQTGIKNIVCTQCDVVTETVIIEALGHGETKEVVTLEPTCTEKGSKNIVCTVCGEVLETIEIDALGHSFERDYENDIAPTCTTAGKHAYKCACGETELREGEAALGHRDAKEVVIKPATCTEAGEKHIVCGVCGEIIIKVTIDALGHGETKTVTVKEATCTESGIAQIVCKACGGVVIDNVEIPATGHGETKEEILEPTCTENGYKKVICSVCGEVLETTVIDALGHGETKEVIVKEPEIGVAGSKNIICTVCGEVIEIVEIPALAYEKGDVNGDGSVDAKDLRLVKFVLAELIALDDPEIKNTEVDDETGEMNAKDLRAIKLMLAELPIS